MKSFQFERDSDGIALIAWDCPGLRMNVMSWDCLQEMSELFDRAFADPEVRGIVLTSGKPHFAGGMDLDLLARIKVQANGDKAKGVFRGVMGFHRVLRKIERAGMVPKTGKGGKPVAAALPGTGVGIGYEIPIACHRIFAADNPNARIGLPEIKVGLFPGAGGTTRLVRRLGVMAAAPLLLKGSTPDPQKALALGTIDEVTPPEKLLERAKEWVLSASPDDIVKQWDRKGWRLPGGRPYDKQGFMTFAAASAMLSAETSGVYPAANALMSAIYEGCLVPFDSALEVEARWFTKVILDSSSTNMIQTLFLDKKTLERGLRRPASVERAAFSRIGVVGAGMMGSGIALVAAQAGIDVTLLDRDADAAEGGKDRAAGILSREVKRKRVTKEDSQEALGRIRPSCDYRDLAGSDLVIEAVFEDPGLKAKVIADIGASAGETCVIATNTSTLPVTELAKNAPSADRFLGMHFFSPVHRMMLVEIIRGGASGDAAVARALDFTARIRKTPIVVNDARFFYTNRCIIPYLNEGIRMVGEGVTPALVENAAKHSGMPVGPLQLIDETSIELGVSIAKATKAAMGDAYMDQDVDDVMHTLVSCGRMGRKANAGFYDYGNGGRRQGLWPGLRRHFASLEKQPSVETVRSRLLLVQALEAVRALQDGVLTDVREGDVGAVLGWGFAPWSGGPFSWLDLLGAGPAVALCDDMRNRFGARFAAPQLLRAKAASGERFTSH